MRAALLLIGLFWPAAAIAQTPLRLSYEGTLGGLRMIHADVVLDQTASGYVLRTHVQSVGALVLLARGYTDVVSQGTWRNGTAQPSRVDSEGTWNGRPRRLVVDYQNGLPVIQIMQPPDPKRLRAVTRDSVAGTTDLLGLVVGLMRQVAATGGCARSARVFDGLGVTQFDMRTGSHTPGPQESLLRCDFTTTKVSGPHGRPDPARQGHGYALFTAAAAGMPPVPARIVFQTRWTGAAVLALTGAPSAPHPAS
jgi:hypothetical protein